MKRDLYICEKKHVCIEKEPYLYVERDLYIYEKRHIYI